MDGALTIIYWILTVTCMGFAVFLLYRILLIFYRFKRLPVQSYFIGILYSGKLDPDIMGNHGLDFDDDRLSQSYTKSSNSDVLDAMRRVGDSYEGYSF